MFSFSPDQSLLLQVSLDNRIFLWDTATNSLRQQYAEKYHLTAQYTCVSYGNEPVAHHNPKKQESKGLGYAALGNSKGSIVVWDLTKDEHKILEQTHAGRVTDVALTKDCSKFYSCCDMDKHVFEWDLKTGKVTRKFIGGKPGVNRLCVNSTGTRLLTAGPNIRLWDLKTGEKLKRFVGHSTPVTSLSFISDDLIISACEDRFISIWNSREKKMKDPKKVPNVKKPVMTLASPSTPQDITVVQAGGSTKCRVIVCGNSKDVYGWDVQSEVDKDDKKGKEPNFTMKNANAVCAQLRSITNVMVARSTEIKPMIEEISLNGFSKQGDKTMKPLKTDGTTTEDEEETKDEVDSQAASKTTQKTSLQKKVNVITDSNAKLAIPKLNIDSNEDDSEDEAEEDRPLRERVEEMANKLADLTENEKIQQNDSSESSETRKRKREVNSASSLSTVLGQALQANDDDLMEICLSQTDPTIIAETVKRLESPRVRQFIRVIIKKFEDRPSRSPLLLSWISTLLKYHAEYLITVPDLARSLGGLYETIQARLGVFKKLLKLSGRLDFLVSQVEVYGEGNHAARASRAKRKKHHPLIKQQATILYDEAIRE